jgi:hypothetical protein
MNAIDKKVLKKVFKTIEKSRKCMKKLNKSVKNKTGFKKCEQFCKNDYVVEMKRIEKKIAKQYDLPYFNTKEKELDKNMYNDCKKTFCNEKCDCYDPSGYNKKNIKNGFHKTYSKNKIDTLKRKGALSGCLVIPDYDVFHK